MEKLWPLISFAAYFYVIVKTIYVAFMLFADVFVEGRPPIDDREIMFVAAIAVWWCVDVGLEKCVGYYKRLRNKE